MRGSAVAPRVTRILATRRRLEEQDHQGVVGDVEFDFLDDGVGEVVLSKSSSSDECCSNEIELPDDVDERESDASVEENRSFWDNQQQLLQSVICRTSSLETGVRNATKEALKEIENTGTLCGSCGSQVALIRCRRCLMREVSRRLQSQGYNSALCKTKWRTSKDIPAGEHNFIDVIDNSSPKKGELRVIIELNLRAEFEMARGSEDYNHLVGRLPEVFVGKAERLSNVIKIMCTAAKKCMEQKKMHLGPWRRQRYMKMKWLGPCDRNTSNWTGSFNMWDNNNNNNSSSDQTTMKTKAKESMLTVDLLDKLPNVHCKAVAVV